MFDSITVDAERWWLIICWLAWAALLFGGFAFGKLNARQTYRMPDVGRLGSSLVLVVAAWSWYLFTRESEAVIYTLPIAIGMTFGLIGDLFMAGKIPVSQPTIGGMGAFGLGHIAYIIGIVRTGDALGLTAGDARLIAWGAWLLIGAVGWWLAVYRGAGERNAMHWIALVYALLLASTAGVATGLALQESAFIPLALGAALFLLSDLIIAAQLFKGVHFRSIGDVIWLTYGPAQMLIVYSADGVLRLLGGA